MPWSVEVTPDRGSALEVWDVIVGRPVGFGAKQRQVYLRRSDDAMAALLCTVLDSYDEGGYGVVVHGLKDTVVGLPIVHGFRTIHAAVKYAIAARSDINRRWKAGNSV